MDKSRRLYARALKIYNQGCIYKAINLCEESISLDASNVAALNLKGLLYYLNGDLERAQKTWKINARVNKDSVAQKYLEDSKKDKVNLEKYINAVNAVKNLKINEALELLKMCSESDYNCINVNNYKALCYIKKGEYIKAQECIDKVLSVDKRNSMAKKNIKMLAEYDFTGKGYNFRKIGKTILAVVIIVIFIGGVSFGVKSIITREKIKASNDKKVNSVNVKKTQISKEKKKPSKENIEKFSAGTMQEYINNKDFESMYNYFEKWKDKNLSGTDKELVQNAAQILSGDEAVEYFYNSGYSLINSQDYEKAKSGLYKAYQFGSNNYLYPHIIYLLGLSYNSTDDKASAVKYFNEYDENFSNGDYEDAVLYDLVIIYKDTEIAKAKMYAQKLTKNYPSSIYNNSIVNSVINQ
ncbi:hypothetical protein D4Z93_01555 [Clostridium fermenticellae]|uniref:Tetratricopeptide repeat protein n=1 Tax=Clostridium fermenticellae TaxID=2068654 RepID=A0A386H0S3_9CLOT|nr:tetratricopeptide repeat protein [Clostridium fermenticellae]AYD39297.1 hypothetical protein D4Z93_01555 [Clostridium fermenticellae]